MRIVRHPNVVELKAFYYSNGDRVSVAAATALSPPPSATAVVGGPLHLGAMGKQVDKETAPDG